MSEAPGYVIHRYHPRIEGLFARIERWTDSATGEIHSRSITRDNIATVYGKDNNSRIFDPADPDPAHPTRTFSWLTCQRYDGKGNAIDYEYAEEDDPNIDRIQANQRNRLLATTGINPASVVYASLCRSGCGTDLTLSLLRQLPFARCPAVRRTSEPGFAQCAITGTLALSYRCSDPAVRLPSEPVGGSATSTILWCTIGGHDHRQSILWLGVRTLLPWIDVCIRQPRCPRYSIITRCDCAGYKWTVASRVRHDVSTSSRARRTGSTTTYCVRNPRNPFMTQRKAFAMHRTSPLLSPIAHAVAEHYSLLQILVLVVLLTLAQGCSTMTVVSKQASQADDTIKKTRVAMWWGLSDPVELVDCPAGDQKVGLKIVSTRTNWLYALCTVVTLGAVVPLEVEYRCTSTCMQDGGVIGMLKEHTP